MRNTFFLLTIALGLAVTSCVPAKQYQELQTKQQRCEEERRQLLGHVQDLETDSTEMAARIASLLEDLESMANDTSQAGDRMRDALSRLGRLSDQNKALLDKQGSLLTGNQAESQRLLAELQGTQEDLQRREDELRELERALNAKEKNLDNLNRELLLREQRVAELEGIIARQDSAANALRNSLEKALLGFQDKGLSVEQRNGKIYVSLEAKLLFPSGSTKINPEGKNALVELAKVLKAEKDLGILVEGHTDSDKIRGGSYQDNWDLSTARANAVVRLLTTSGLDPQVLTAAGRGEFNPLDPGKTPEAKAKNRRIEVILTPNLDRLFEIIDKR